MIWGDECRLAVASGFPRTTRPAVRWRRRQTARNERDKYVRICLAKIVAWVASANNTQHKGEWRQAVVRQARAKDQRQRQAFDLAGASDPLGQDDPLHWRRQHQRTVASDGRWDSQSLARRNRRTLRSCAIVAASGSDLTTVQWHTPQWLLARVETVAESRLNA
jgi:hypothetical protein